MSKQMNLVERLVKEDEAGTAVEYGLVTAVIAVALIAALIAFRDELAGMFNRAGDSVRANT